MLIPVLRLKYSVQPPQRQWRVVFVFGYYRVTRRFPRENVTWRRLKSHRCCLGPGPQANLQPPPRTLPHPVTTQHRNRACPTAGSDFISSRKPPSSNEKRSHGIPSPVRAGLQFGCKVVVLVGCSGAPGHCRSIAELKAVMTASDRVARRDPCSETNDGWCRAIIQSRRRAICGRQGLMTGIQ